MRKIYSKEEYAEACRISSLVYAEQISRNHGIQKLIEFGINETSASDFIVVYKSLVEGKSFLRGAGADAIHYFIDFIIQKHGISFRKNAIIALKHYIERNNSNNKMNAVLEYFEQQDRNNSENFPSFWNTLQIKLKAGDSIKNWTARKGYLGDEFRIIQVLDDCVKVDSPNAGTIQIARKSDFEFMLNNWEAYCIGKVQRKELTAETFVSKYTMSIIKHIETLSTANPVFTDEEFQFTEKIAEDIENFVVGLEGFEGEERDAIVKVRVNQGKFREILLNYWNNTCAVSDLKEEKLLVASHILPWSKSTKHQQGDPFNGLLLSVVWDSLFDKGLISFDDNGKAILDKLSNETIECLGLKNEPYVISPKKLTNQHKQYLNMHRMLYYF